MHTHTMAHARQLHPAAAASLFTAHHCIRQQLLRCSVTRAAGGGRAGLQVAASSHGSSSSRVDVQLTATSFSSRKLQATVGIHAPLPVVWDALTDYDNLGTFIPSLVENRCLKRRSDGCLLYQVGAQDVAMGLKFSAKCTLEITEWPVGIPTRLVSSGSDLKRHFPSPNSSPTGSSGGSGGGVSSRATSSSNAASSSSHAAAAASSSSSSSGGVGVAYSTMMSIDDETLYAVGSGEVGGVRDISFNLVAGDFQAFKGIWRMEPAPEDPSSTTLLHYALFVRPHPWLPVKLIEDRISSEVANNLSAVRRHTEHVAKRQARQRQQQQQQQAERQQQQLLFSQDEGPVTTSTGGSSSSSMSVASSGSVSGSESGQGVP